MGPFVQPSLFENWVTGVFEFAARQPLVFSFVQSMMLVGLVGALAALWGLLGRGLGIIQRTAQPRHFQVYI